MVPLTPRREANIQHLACRAANNWWRGVPSGASGRGDLFAGERRMGHTTSGIRNIALVGAAGAGKTLLAESLLLQAGAIRARGSLARGSTVSDFDPQEKALQHSLEPAILTFDCDSTRIHLIDTPGYPDFLGRTFSVLEAVEAVAIVVS